MINILQKSMCTGCSSCFYACPKNCIKMTVSDDGFLYPEVNEALCVKCGLCIKHCPVLSPLKNNKTIKDITSYAAKSKDDTLRKQSSSGGIFSEIALHILNLGGVVFGVSLDNDLIARHIFIEKEEDLSKLQGSKYVQSIIGDSYQKVEEFLKAKKLVLFSGTPCQTNGLLSYLNKDYENLYTQDIICHGVPSPLVWEKYKKHIEIQESEKIDSVSFRDKTQGWKNYSVSFKFKSGKLISKLSKNDEYMNIFLRDLCLRPSCYDCKFKTMTRSTDITLADFWGIDKILPEMDDGKGTSLVFINSVKGQKLFSAIEKNLICKETPLEESVSSNPSMIRSVNKPPERDKFLADIKNGDFAPLAKKYLKVSVWKKIKHKLLKKIKKR